jgi:trehalose 6-phosphate phosphatase
LTSNRVKRLNPDGSREMTRLDEMSIHALAEADSWLDGLGLHHLAEHKPGSVAVHWRGLHSGEQNDIRKIVMLSWLPVAHRAGMVLQEFDGGVEMRPANCDKADAVRTVLSELEPDTPVAYLGDDQTDENAFLALSGRGLRVLVRQRWRQTRADMWLQPPAELQVFLCDWLDACQAARRRTLRRAC